MQLISINFLYSDTCYMIQTTSSHIIPTRMTIIINNKIQIDTKIFIIQDIYNTRVFLGRINQFRSTTFIPYSKVTYIKKWFIFKYWEIELWC